MTTSYPGDYDAVSRGRARVRAVMLECGNVASIPRVEGKRRIMMRRKKLRESRAQKRKRGKKLMRKTVIRLTLCAMLFALSYSASAQQPTKIPQIGYLAGASPSSNAARAE